MAHPTTATAAKYSKQEVLQLHRKFCTESAKKDHEAVFAGLWKEIKQQAALGRCTASHCLGPNYSNDDIVKSHTSDAYHYLDNTLAQIGEFKCTRITRHAFQCRGTCGQQYGCFIFLKVTWDPETL